MRDYISSLVRQTILEFYRKKDQKPQILILSTNDRSNRQELMKHIESLTSQFYIILLISKKDEELTILKNTVEIIFAEDLIEAQVNRLTETIELVYCPVISREFLAKLSLLLDDSQPVWFVLKMLMEGKEILLGIDSIQNSKHVQFWKTSFVENKVKFYMKELRNNGVYFCTMNQAESKISEIIHKLRDKKPLLLGKQIEEAASSGVKEIKVPKNCLITPMARDVARELNMKIIEDIDEGKRDDL